MEARPTRTHHALAKSLGRGFPWLALRMYGNGPQVFGQPIRHTWWRNGPRFPAPRVRDSASRGLRRRTDGALLDAQQHDNHQRTEDGKEPRQLHHARTVLQRLAFGARKGLFAHDHSFLHPLCPLSRNGGFLQRSPASQRERTRKIAQRHRRLTTHSARQG